MDPLFEHPFLRGVDPALLAPLAGGARSVTFAPGAYLLREGDIADTFYLLHTGRVSLEVHMPGKGPVRVETVGAGEALGLSWLFPPTQVHLDARALEPTRALALDAIHLRRAMEQSHDLGYALTQRLLRLTYDRLERVRLQRLDVFGGQGP